MPDDLAHLKAIVDAVQAEYDEPGHITKAEIHAALNTPAPSVPEPKPLRYGTATFG